MAIYLLALGTAILLAVSVIYMTALIHEGAHWLGARIWTDKLSVSWKYGVVPRRLIFHQPRSMSHHTVRIAAAAPFLISVPIGLLIFYTLPGTFNIRLGIALPFLAAGSFGFSPSDLLGIFFPERFQEYCESGGTGAIETFKILLEELNKYMYAGG